MNTYHIIALSEADHKLCFVEYHCCPEGVPDTPEEAVKYALKWHRDLGINKFRDVKFWVKLVDGNDYQRIIIKGVGDQSTPEQDATRTETIIQSISKEQCERNPERLRLCSEVNPEPLETTQPPTELKTTDWREYAQKHNPEVFLNTTDTGDQEVESEKEMQAAWDNLLEKHPEMTRYVGILTLEEVTALVRLPKIAGSTEEGHREIVAEAIQPLTGYKTSGFKEESQRYAPTISKPRNKGGRPKKNRGGK